MKWIIFLLLSLSAARAGAADFTLIDGDLKIKTQALANVEENGDKQHYRVRQRVEKGDVYVANTADVKTVAGETSYHDKFIVGWKITPWLVLRGVNRFGGEEEKHTIELTFLY